jgi:hypothetical protein
VTLRQISFALLFRRFAPCDSHHSLHFGCAFVSTKPKPFFGFGFLFALLLVSLSLSCSFKLFCDAAANLSPPLSFQGPQIVLFVKVYSEALQCF